MLNNYCGYEFGSVCIFLIIVLDRARCEITPFNLRYLTYLINEFITFFGNDTLLPSQIYIRPGELKLEISFCTNYRYRTRL